MYKDGDLPSPEEIEDAHWRFHRSLLAGCGSSRLLTLQETLYQQANCYRSIMMKQWHGMQQVTEIHDQLAEIILTRDIERACAALRDHLEATLSLVYPKSDVKVS